MISRRTLLTGFAIASSIGAGVFGGYAGRHQVRAALDWAGADKTSLPEQSLIGAEFMRGQTERIGDLLVSKSEARWLRENHGGVTDPVAIVQLLSPV